LRWILNLLPLSKMKRLTILNVLINLRILSTLSKHKLQSGHEIAKSDSCVIG
jgi:hypothetical protein